MFIWQSNPLHLLKNVLFTSSGIHMYLPMPQRKRIVHGDKRHFVIKVHAPGGVEFRT